MFHTHYVYLLVKALNFVVTKTYIVISMTKKILLIIFVLLIGTVGFIGYNFYKNSKQPINTNALIAVPQNAAIILREQNINAFVKKITSTNIIWEELINNTDRFVSINQQLLFLDSLVQLTNLSNFLADKSILASLHLSGANSYDFIFYMTTPPGTSEKEIIELLKKELNINPTTRNYDDEIIYTFTNKNNKIAFTYNKNIVAFSYSTILIEDVVRQLKANTSLLDNADFAQILNTTGEVPDGNIFLNHQKFPVLMAQLFNPTYNETILEAKNYAVWSALDISIKSNAIMLNGFTFSPEDKPYFIALFKNQTKTIGTQKIKLTTVIPRNTAFLYYYSFSNAKQFFKDRVLWLKQVNNFFAYQQFTEKLTNDYGIDIEEELLSIIGNELSFIITEPIDSNIKNNQFIVFQTQDKNQAKTNLQRIQQKLNNIPTESIIFNDFEIAQLNIDNLFRNLFGKPFVNIKQPFYVIIDDYVVFGASELSLKTFITDFIAEKTLEKDINFQSFSDQLSSNASLFVYNNIARSIHLYKAFAKEELIANINEKTEFLRKFEAVAFQINPTKNNLFYNNVYFKYNPVYKQDTRTLWETLLDTTINNSPQLVVNHITNTKEVFVQDVSNKIYLISTNGKILWTKQLQHQLLGKVHQIDVFKNGKLQLLFNTKNKIYLIDRNGENMPNFPVQLKAEATTNIAPLDYDKNKNYRLLIGCSNNEIYNYTTDGKLLTGWEYTPTKSSPNGLIRHFIQGNKDYIVITTKNGKVKIVQRNGKDRLELKNTLLSKQNSCYLTVGKDLSSTYLTALDSAGSVAKLFFNDKLEQLKPSSASTPQYLFFSETSITPTTNGVNYFYAFNNTFIVNDANQNTLINIELDKPIIAEPMLFNFPNNTKKIGVVTASSIYLINAEGNIEADFPLAGSTPFMIDDINNDNILNLVVGEKNLVYLYNLK